MAGALAAEIGAEDSLLPQYLCGFVVSAAGAPLGADTMDPAELASAARRQANADVGVAAVLNTGVERPAAEFAVDVRGLVKADTSRWNFRIPELRRRAAVEALALLLNTLRSME